MTKDDFIRMIARMEHSGDESFTHPDDGEDYEELRAVMDRLIAEAQRRAWLEQKEARAKAVKQAPRLPSL